MAVDVRRVLSHLGIEDVREENGRIWAPCPFHEDSPKWLAGFKAGREKGEWFIRPAGDRRGHHHCFGCEARGTLVSLVMHVVDVGFPAAKEWLEKFEGAPEPLKPIPVGVRFTYSGNTAFRLPSGVEWGAPLESWTTPMRRYAESRGLTSKQIERWGIAYSLEGRLRERIVIPLHDQEDEIVSYMARARSKDEPVRYLTPALSDNPDLDAIFGERCWPSYDLRKRSILVVCEGGLNALACERAGALYIAALGGSHVRALHVAKVASFGRVIVLTDSDDSGDSAALHLGAAVESQTAVVRLRLPDGKDAAQSTVEELRSWLDSAVNLFPSRS